MSILWIILWSLFAIIVIAGFFMNRILKKDEALKAAEQTIFMEIFRTSTFRQPSFERGSCYGWPTFYVSFSTKEDYDHAERQGHCELFRSRIAALQRPGFDAEIAFDFGYPGKHYGYMEYE
jgi:hypothetical protein